MPEHQSWLTVFLPRLEAWLRGIILWMNHLGNPEGKTWFANAEVGPHYVTQPVVALFFVIVVIAVIAWVAYPKLKDVQAAIVPDEKLSARTFLELFVDYVYNLEKDIMGEKAARFFLPLIGTCAFLILFSNALGLIPGMLPPTESLNTTLACAAVIFLATHIFGLKENGMAHIKHLFGPWLGPLGIPLNLLMFVIECVSHVARPISLSIRLMANLAADHKVLFAFTGLASFMGYLLIPVPVLFLGTVVVVVQTLVFCILSSVYIGMAVQHHDHEHDGHDHALDAHDGEHAITGDVASHA